jgi:hypothetical protein
MSKKIRDWLFGIFVFLFVTITIILSLYATGYRFNLSWPLRFDRLLVKTGTLALDTLPKGATISIVSETKISSGFPLIGSKKEEVTPVKIKNLLPGDYTISFTLDNYWPYEKKLHVYPEQTTFLENVILFKKSLPLNVFQTTPQKIDYSANDSFAWLENDGKIINLKTEEVISSSLSQKINWLANGKQILDGSKLINLDNGNVTDYKAYTGDIDEAQMSGNFLVYQSKNNLAAFDVSSKATTLISSGSNILAYDINNNILLSVAASQTKTELKSYDLNSKSSLGAKDLLSAKSFSFNQDNSKYPILSDNEHKIVYILSIDSQGANVVNVVRGATVFKWLDGNRLAYITESEIYIYDVSQNKSYLLTRLSEKINSLDWSTNNYLIYATESTIGTINLTNEGNDIMILWQGSSISSLHFVDKTGILYFSGSVGQQSGLYKMSLR